MPPGTSPSCARSPTISCSAARTANISPSTLKKRSQEAVRYVSGLELDPECLGIRPACWTRGHHAIDDGP